MEGPSMEGPSMEGASQLRSTKHRLLLDVLSGMSSDVKQRLPMLRGGFIDATFSLMQDRDLTLTLIRGVLDAAFSLIRGSSGDSGSSSLER